MELDDMSFGVQEVTVISENGAGFGAGSEVRLDILSELDDVVNNIIASVTSPPSKKLKETEEVGMEIDQNVEEELLCSEEKQAMMHQVRRMSRKDLEDLVLTKTVEAISKHSEVGKYRTKILEFELHKEKLQNKVVQLLTQINQIGRCVKTLLDNRDPNNLNPDKKPPPPIRYCRSVGLQVTIEPSVRNEMSKAIHVNHVNGVLENGVKLLNGAIPFKKPGPKSLTQPRAIDNNNNNVRSQTVANQMNGHLVQAKAVTSITVPSRSVSLPTVVDISECGFVPSPRPSEDNSGLFKLTNNRAPGSHQLLLNGQSRHTQVAPTVSTGHRLVSVIRPGLYTEPIQIQSRAPVGLEPPIRPAAFIPQRPQNRQEINRPMRVHLPSLPPPPVVNLPHGKVMKELPPRTILTPKKEPEGIVLSWKMPLMQRHEEIALYQIYACQESLASGRTSCWKFVGDVDALPLPMACTLSQFAHGPGNRYFFIVRAVDRFGRTGAFCEPGPITV